jgi:glycosyltransferase involved in cell wall biosynthesis
MYKRIRVVQLIKNFSIESGGGGIERFGIALAQALDPTRFEVCVCGLWNSGTAIERQRIRQMNTIGVEAFTAANWDETHPYQAFRMAFLGLRDWLSQHPTDILNCHSEFSDMAVLPFGMKRKPAILRTVHNREWLKRPLRRMFLTNFLYPLLFKYEIGVSMGIVDTLNCRPLARLFRKQALCIHNAVDLGRFDNTKIDTNEKRVELGLPLDAPVIGTVGRLTQQKGYAFLLDAAVQVLNEMPEARFVIVGDGEYASALQSQAARLGISDRIQFTGPRPDVEELLGVFTLFVSSSLWEGLPTVILESMAAGVPVVATDIPGTRELAANHAIGWLAPPGNEQALGSAILAALRDPAQREVCAVQARTVVHSFSIQAIAAEYEAVYTTIAGEQR